MAELIDQISDEDFLKAVSSCKNYTEIASKLGLQHASAAVEVRDRIREMKITFRPSPSRWLPDEEFFTENNYHTSHNLRRRLQAVKSRPYKCAICGLEPLWNGKELTLEVDHISGDSSDCRLENLRWLCPNCHSQTSTFRGKNKHSKRIIRYGVHTCDQCGQEFTAKHRTAKYCSRSCAAIASRKKPPVTKDELYLLLKSGTFSSVARKYGVSPNAVIKWCKKYSLPHHASSYK